MGVVPEHEQCDVSWQRRRTSGERGVAPKEESFQARPRQLYVTKKGIEGVRTGASAARRFRYHRETKQRRLCSGIQEEKMKQSRPYRRSSRYARVSLDRSSIERWKMRWVSIPARAAGTSGYEEAKKRWKRDMGR